MLLYWSPAFPYAFQEGEKYACGSQKNPTPLNTGYELDLFIKKKNKLIFLHCICGYLAVNVLKDSTRW